LTASGLPQERAALNANAVRSLLKSANVLGICLGVCLLFSAFSTASERRDFKLEFESVSLFNGKDLTAWGYLTNNFDGKLNGQRWPVYRPRTVFWC
jgi:hypothetical protein